MKSRLDIRHQKVYFCTKWMRMNKTKITLVRHGETEWNVAMRLQGTKNSPLTENGIKQAELVAEALSQQKFHRLISSDLDRALKTAAILNIYHHLQIEEEPALRERNFGIMEGLTRDEIHILYLRVKLLQSFIIGLQ
jgi:broad specificity phosphatase PhoE